MLTDQTGAVVWDVDYSPFGEISAYVTNTLPVDQPFRFPGQYQDTMTGLYYNWNRYYMPEVGRYNRVDLETYESILFSDNYVRNNINLHNNLLDNYYSNTYLYALNNSISSSDFEGKAIRSPGRLYGKCVFGKYDISHPCECEKCPTQICKYMVVWACACLFPDRPKVFYLLGYDCTKHIYFIGCGNVVKT